ncbi:hypothetical protein NX059_009021 [Plenodomus lindquistii]|nr:hypothetical protein NX059_009021 [Plenodomus lindquistii]
MIFLVTYLVGILAITTNATPTTLDCPRKIGAKGVHARLPPAFDPNYTNSKWTPPPAGWYFKFWKMIFASNQQYAAFRNIQYEPTAVDPANLTGLVEELFSFQLRGNDTIYTTYGIDTPDPQYPAVLRYNATGIIAGATSEYSILAWGCDANGEPYYTSYSTATEATSTPAGIDVLSTNPRGPDDATSEAIIGALKGLGNAEITELVNNFTRMAYDGARDGLPRIVCDDYCKSNQNILGLPA